MLTAPTQELDCYYRVFYFSCFFFRCFNFILRLLRFFRSITWRTLLPPFWTNFRRKLHMRLQKKQKAQAAKIESSY